MMSNGRNTFEELTIVNGQLTIKNPWNFYNLLRILLLQSSIVNNQS